MLNPDPVVRSIPDRMPKLDHITLDNLSLKIADTQDEITAAQNLRYEVFYKELGARPINDMEKLSRDYDEFDPVCDHLLVIDNAAPKDQQIIGTYRLLLLEKAQQAGITLYTETEFDLSRVKSKGGRILEISRSCVLPAYRSKMAINLLWKGIAAFVFGWNVDYLLGTPSFQGTDLSIEHDTLAYLNAYHLAAEDIRPRALDPYYNPLPVMEKEQLNARQLFNRLPPLVKGYLRTGSMIGDGTFIDHQFNTIDIAIILDMARVDPKYLSYYSRNDAE